MAGFGVPVTLGAQAGGATPCPTLDLLNLPRPPASAPVGLREGGRGLRPGVRLLRHPVLPGPAAQPPPSTDPRRGRPAPAPRRSCWSPRTWPPTARPGRRAPAPSCPLVEAVAGPGRPGAAALPVPVRPHRRLVDAICATGVPVLRPVAPARVGPLLRRMRRWGDGDRFLRRIDDIRGREPDAAFRSNFIVGYPGETEEPTTTSCSPSSSEAQLDWCGFFAYSRGGRHLRRRPRRRRRRRRSMAERLAELRELQDAHHRRPARRADRRPRSRCSWTRPGVGPQPPRGPRDRRHRRTCPSDLAVGRVRARCASTGADGSRPRCASVDVGWAMATDASARPRWPRRPTSSPSRGCSLAPAAVRDDRRQRGLVGGLRSCGSRCASPTASTATWPAGRAPPAPARSSTRWPTRCSCSAPCSPWCQRTCSGGCRWRLIAVREVAISMYRSLAGAAGHRGPGRAEGEGEDRRAGVAVGFALLPLTARRRAVAASTRPVGRRGAHRGHGRAVPAARRRPTVGATASSR